MAIPQEHPSTLFPPMRSYTYAHQNAVREGLCSFADVECHTKDSAFPPLRKDSLYVRRVRSFTYLLNIRWDN